MIPIVSCHARSRNSLIYKEPQALSLSISASIMEEEGTWKVNSYFVFVDMSYLRAKLAPNEFLPCGTPIQIICLSLRLQLRQIIYLLAPDKSRYVTQPCAIIATYSDFGLEK